MSNIRISKVLNELNIGLDTAIDFLHDKGHDVEKNRNAKISDEQYDMLLAGFASDKSKKDAAEQVSQKVREEKAVLRAEKEALKEETKQAEVETQPEVVAETPAAPEPVVEETPVKEEPKVEKVEEVKAPVVEEIQPEPQPDPQPETKVEKVEPVEEKVVAEEPKAVEPPVVEQPKVEEKAPETDGVIRAKATLSGPKMMGKIDLTPKPKAKPAQPVQPKQENKPAKPEQPKADKPVEQSKPAPAPEAAKPQAPKSEEKPAAAPAPEASDEKENGKIETKYQTLAGPRLTGQTIDLSQFNKPKKKKVASSTEPVDNKGKRKRIRPDRPQGAGTPGTGNNTPGTGAGQAGGNRPGGNQPGNRNNNNNRNAGNRPNNRGGNKPAPAKVELTDEDIQKQIKETLEKLTGNKKSKSSKIRRDKRAERRDRQAMAEIERQEGEKVLKVTEFLTVMELANMMDVNVNQIIGTCMSLGIMVTMNQRLDAETLGIVAEEFGFSVEFVDTDVTEALAGDVQDSEEDLLPRAPIVTVMGHVDHGKTSLLDYIRKANVIAGEAGGITQHIGAYAVTLANGQKITFLDTPGHEAFTAMRARGAQITDVAIIVVAADDAVMPQTKEAIAHAQAAGVPIVFAINKVDRPTANPEKIKEQLAQMNLLVEDWGGKIQSQDISAKTGLNVQELLEKVLLEAELLDLKANPNRIAKGAVIEASLDKGRGYVSTILVQTGTLKIGDYLLAGQNSGKVRAMMDERGHRVMEAGPSSPVSILGLDGAPQAGDSFIIMEDEKEAKQIAQRRQQLSREQSARAQKNLTLEEIGRRLAIGDFQELNIILKGDVDGSIEALSDSLQRLSTEEIQVNIIHKAVGQITESDVLLASASKAIIVGFQVRPSAPARKIAEKEDIEIRLYSIIYDAINDIKDAMEGMLSPELKEEIVATLEVRETFKISKVGTIAGCMVLDGSITRNTRIRIIRDGVVVHTGELGSLKRFKDDVKEVNKGYDCGLNINNFNDIRVGDIIEGFKEVQVQRTL